MEEVVQTLLTIKILLTRLLLLLLLMTPLLINSSVTHAEVVKAYYPSQDMGERALISFHGELIAADYEAGFLLLDITSQQQTFLTGLGFVIEAASNEGVINPSPVPDPLPPTSTASNVLPRFSVTATTGILGFSCYPTVEEIYSGATALTLSYPNLVSWIDIGDSWRKTQNQGGYDLNVLKITNSATALQYPDKPVLFINAGMHAREYATTPLALAFAETLLSGYETEADITWILDRHEIHLLLTMNPDGRKIAENDATKLKRKNDNAFYCAPDAVDIGVDLNRNFSWFWRAANDNPEVRASDNHCSEVFRGPSPASESETQAVENYLRSVFIDNRGPDINDMAAIDTRGLHLDIHSFGQLMLYPWGHSTDAAPNGDALRTLARKLAYFNQYTARPAIGLYPVDGSSESISYGELGLPHVTFELGSSFYESCDTYEKDIKPKNLQALLYAAKIADAAYLLPLGPDWNPLHIKGRLNPDITAGSDIVLNATIDDSLYSERNGIESSQFIAAAEYSIDKAFWDVDALPIAIDAAGLDDGVFDSYSEDLTLRLSSAGLNNGRHTIYLRARDAVDNWGPVSARYFTLIDNRYLEPRMTFDCYGNVCDFDASESLDTDGDIAEYLWDFGDGTQSSELKQKYHFLSNGDYLVTLTVVGEDGEQSSVQETITIAMPTAAPQPQILYDCDLLQCSFDASASPAPESNIVFAVWFFTEDFLEPMNGVQFDFEFSEAGDYLVSVLVFDDQNWIVPAQLTITVTDTAPMPVSPQSSNSGGGGSISLLSLLFLAVGSLLKFSSRNNSVYK